MLKYTKEDLQKVAEYVSTEQVMLRYVRFPIILMILTGRHEIGIRTSSPLWMSALPIVFACYWISMGNFDLLFLLFLSIGVLIGWMALRPFRDYKNMLTFLKKRNFYDMAVCDFYSATPFLEDNIRLGHECVFGKSFCTILRYTDIRRIYQYVYKLNFVEWNRELHAVDTQGKVWRLCELKLHSMFNNRKNELADQEVIKVLNFMLYKNNRIAIGYRP